MTPQEQQMIDDLVGRIRTTQVADKDMAAEQHLQQGLAGDPNALYVLAQTVLVQQYGLEQAKVQIQDLQQQIQDLQQQLQDLQSQIGEMQQHPPQQPSGGGSFLSHLFGGAQQQTQAPPQQPPYQPVNNPGYSSAGYPSGGYPAQAYPTQGYPPQYAQAYGQPGYGQPMGYPSGGGGFLRGALQTAAGVAAGQAAFAGIESLFHGFGGGGYGSGFAGGRPEEIINNNYYDEDRGERRGGLENTGLDSDRGSDDGLRDASYTGGTGEDHFADTNDSDMNLQSDDADSSLDNSNVDDSSSDDSNLDDSSFDSGGDSDDNSSL